MTKQILNVIAQAITGGALAGLSKEAQMDFFGPFMQAQENRLNREEQQESNAFGSFSQSSKASREAFASDPLATGRYQAYADNAKKRLDMALANVKTPAARQAILDNYEADIAFGDSTVKRAKEGRNLEQGMRGKFDWADGSEESQTALTSLLAEGSPMSNTYQSLVTFAAQFPRQSAGATVDSSALPAGLLTPDENALISMVNKVDGGLRSYIDQHPEEGPRILSLLSKVDPGSIKARTTELAGIRDDRNFQATVGGILKSSERASKLTPLAEPELWRKDENGTRSFRPEVTKYVTATLLGTNDTNNAVAAWQLAKQTFGKVEGVDLKNIQDMLFSSGTVQEVDTLTAKKAVVPATEALKELYDKGLPGNLSPFALRRIAQGDNSPLLGRAPILSGSDLSPESVDFVGKLYRGEGQDLIFDPLMDQWLGDDAMIAANVSAQNDLYQRSLVENGPDALETIQLKAELDARMSLQSDPSVRAGITTVTKSLLNAALTDDWDSYLQLLAPQAEGVLLSNGDGIDPTAKQSLMDLVNRPGMSPAQKMREAANWAITRNYAFKKESLGDQPSVALNTAARSKFLMVAEKWASATESEQQPVSSEMGAFLGLDSSDVYRSQRVFLRGATLQSINDLHRPATKTGYNVFTKGGLEDAGVSTSGMPTVLGTTSGKF